MSHTTALFEHTHTGTERGILPLFSNISLCELLEIQGKESFCAITVDFILVLKYWGYHSLANETKRLVTMTIFHFRGVWRKLDSNSRQMLIAEYLDI